MPAFKTAIVSLILGSAMLFLPACTSVPPIPLKPTQNSVNHVSMNGVFSAIWSDGHQSGHFTWNQVSPHHFVLILSGPLGIGATQLVENTAGVTLTTSKGKKYQAKTPDALLEKAVGWSVPVDGLSYWLVGLPVPAIHFTATYDDAGRLFNLNQLGWLIQYSWEDGRAYPTEITLLCSEVRVKIVIN